MQPLPPHVKAYADELLAVAPPLTEEAERAIRALAPYVPAAGPQAAAEPACSDVGPYS